MSWETPQACKICGTAMRNIGIGFRALWHCDRCEDRFSAVENRTASEDTKPLFEDWFKDLAVGDQFVASGRAISYDGTCTVTSKTDDYLEWDCPNRLPHHRSMGPDGAYDTYLANAYARGLITPIPRDASRAALAVQDSVASLQTPRTHGNPYRYAQSEELQVSSQDRGAVVPKQHTPQPPESALPDTSDTPSPPACWATSCLCDNCLRYYNYTLGKLT